MRDKKNVDLELMEPCNYNEKFFWGHKKSLSIELTFIASVLLLNLSDVHRSIGIDVAFIIGDLLFLMYYD